MINETKTFELFGYTSDSLTKGSHKKVCVSCDRCGEERITTKRNINTRGLLTTFCVSCSQKNGKHEGQNSPTYKSEISQFIKENQGKHFCQCGCSEEIIILRKYYNGEGIPKFIKNHSSKGKNNPKWKGGLITLVCKQCGDKYEVKPKDKLKAKFCSRKCFGEWKSINESGQNSKVSGSNNPMWQGGITDQKYCSKFNESLKIQIRNQYNNCDYISGLHKNICNKGFNLDVHHVDYNKQQGCDDHQWKLIPLSRVNHMRTNANRSFWNRLFTYSLQYEAEYYGDE